MEDALEAFSTTKTTLIQEIKRLQIKVPLLQAIKEIPELNQLIK